MKIHPKATILILFLISGFISPDATAQLSLDYVTEIEDFPKKRKKRGDKDKPAKSKFENFVLSSGLSLGYSGGLFFNLSPAIGYQVGERLRFNGGVEYYNYNRSQRNLDVTDKSITPFVSLQYLVFNTIFAHAQFQQSNFKRKYPDGFEEKSAENGLLLGAGYGGSAFLPGFDYSIVLTYNVLFEDQANAINFYPSPINYQARLSYRF